MRRGAGFVHFAILLWLLAGTLALAQAERRVSRIRRPARAPIRLSRGPTLAVSVSPRLDPPPTPRDYIDAFDLVESAGATGDVVTATWSSLEPASGVYRLDDLTNDISYAGSVRGLRLLVGIQVVNTTARETPADLAGVPFDAPQMKARFHALLDALRPWLTIRPVAYVSIGNEVDVYLGSHPSEWAPYKAFYEDAAAYLRWIAPGVRVGVTATFDGSSGARSAAIADLNAGSDVLILTYYPLGPGFLAGSPGSPAADFPRMIELSSGRPVVLQEVGYPSATLLASSEDRQAEFVWSVFAAWHQAGGAIPFLSFFLLHDFTPSICTDLARYYGLPGDPAFEAFLCSLGLRRAEGTPKLSWPALVAAARMPF